MQLYQGSRLQLFTKICPLKCAHLICFVLFCMMKKKQIKDLSSLIDMSAFAFDMSCQREQECVPNVSKLHRVSFGR